MLIGYLVRILGGMPITLALLPLTVLSTQLIESLAIWQAKLEQQGCNIAPFKMVWRRLGVRLATL